ncbi:MAG: acetylglutamate kinase [Vulcanimicrobiaceae bacterium]
MGAPALLGGAQARPERLSTVKIVVKYGGNAMGGGADDALLTEIDALRAARHQVVLVHGGGPEIDRALDARGIVSERVDGLRVTDAETLEVTEAVLCATLNKRIVRACLRRGIAAVGISGEDGALLTAAKAHHPNGDLGYVGTISSVNPQPLQALLRAGFVPVVAPLAISEDASHAYNVNADTSAGAIAAALGADAFIALTNVERVLRDPANPSTAISLLSLPEAQAFSTSSGCQSSMRPKMQAAIAAVVGGASRAYICAAKPNAIAGALAGNATIVTR